MNLRKKILTGYLFMLLLLMIMGYVGYQSSMGVKDEFDSLNEDVIPKLSLVDQIKSDIAGQANDERGFLLTGDDQFPKEFLDRAVNADRAIDQAMNNIEDDEKEILLRIKEKHDQFTEIQKKVVSEYKKGNIAEARRLSFNDGRSLRKSIDPLFEEFKKAINNDLKNNSLQIDSKIGMNQGIMIGLGVASVAIGIFLGFYISGRIVKPVKDVVDRSKKLAAGDLTVKEINVNTNDEIRELADSFNTMVKNVRQLVSEVLRSTENVTVTSEQMSSNAGQASKATQQVAVAIQEIARGTGEQASFINNTMETVNQVSTAIEQIAGGAQEQAVNITNTADMVNQMANSIQEVALSAQTVAQSAEKTKEAAGKGENAVVQTINGMEGIKSKVFETAEKIKELGEHSQQIGEIIQVIDEIAEQTNLLALNAAIEAARAGEHGKGFAVVADEVRKLAERSGKATKEIAELITNIQKLTASAVAAMELGTGEVEQGAWLALDAGNALKEILGTVEDTYRQVQNISAAAEQISASSQELVKAIDNVSAITQENTAATEELTAASSQVGTAMESVASVTEQTSAAAEEVSASTEEMAASIDEITVASQGLAKLTRELQQLVTKFRIS